jgi:general secretion pathway protein K
MVRRFRKSERGVALLAVLLGVALMTLVVVDFAMTSGLGFVSAANQANELRAYYMARSAISVGLAILAQDERGKTQGPTSLASGTPPETLSDAWATQLPSVGLEGGNVSVSIVDEARKLNINQMVVNGAPNERAIARVQRLFTILDVNTALIPGIVQWITPANATAGGGGADYYLGLRPPYEPRGGPMPTIADLQLVKGINEAVFNRLRPFLTVMPEATVNINTASPQVIASLEPELTEDQKVVEEIVMARQLRPFSKVTDLVNDIPSVATFGTRLSQDLTTNSKFFTITGMGTYSNARKIVTATFHRENTGVGTLENWHED